MLHSYPHACIFLFWSPNLFSSQNCYSGVNRVLDFYPHICLSTLPLSIILHLSFLTANRFVY